MQLAQLVGDRHVALGVAEADRRGDIQGAPPAAAGACPFFRHGTRGREEPAEQQVHLHRVARVRDVPRAFQRDQLAAGLERQRLALGDAGGPGPQSPWITSVGQRTRAQVSRKRSSRGTPMPRVVSARVCGVVSSAQPMQSSICLLEWGSVKALREEELQEAQVVARPVVAVVLGPALVGFERVLERRDVALRVVGGQRDGRADVDDAVDALGVVGGQDRGPQRAAGQGRPAPRARCRSRPSPRSRRPRTRSCCRPRVPPVGPSARCRARRR